MREQSSRVCVQSTRVKYLVELLGFSRVDSSFSPFEASPCCVLPLRLQTLTVRSETSGEPFPGKETKHASEKAPKKGRGTWVCLNPQLLVRLTATSESKSSTVGRSVDAHRRRNEDKRVDLRLPPGGGRTRSGESDRPARSVLWGHLVARGRNSKFQAASVWGKVYFSHARFARVYAKIVFTKSTLPACFFFI